MSIAPPPRADTQHQTAGRIRQQLILGLPYYGRAWTTQTGTVRDIRWLIQQLEITPRVPALGFAKDEPCNAKPDFAPPDLKLAAFRAGKGLKERVRR